MAAKNHKNGAKKELTSEGAKSFNCPSPQADCYARPPQSDCYGGQAKNTKDTKAGRNGNEKGREGAKRELNSEVGKRQRISISKPGHR